MTDMGDHPEPLPDMTCVGCEAVPALRGGVVCATCLNAEPAEPLVKRYKVGSCWLIVGMDDHGEFCVTRFPDGMELIARPEPFDPEKHLFSDPWVQCWTHEFLHNLLAAANGMPFSPSLRYAAEQQVTDWPARIAAGQGVAVSHHYDMDAIRREEAAVLRAQEALATWDIDPKEIIG